MRPNHYGLGALLLGALACAAYWPTLTLPYISDDYYQIWLARRYGPVEAWGQLAGDPLYRCRATSLVLTWWLERLVGVGPQVLGVASLALHILNTYLVVAFALWRRIPLAVSFVGAMFFAVYEGHQEAVIWFAAVPELLVFLFAGVSFLLWIAWVQGSPRRRVFYALSLGFFVLALLSKESAAVLPGVLMLAGLMEPERRRNLLSTIPFVVLSGLYTLGVFLGQNNHQHFTDGTFSVRAPILLTLTNSLGRLLWFWGALAVTALVWRQRRGAVPLLASLAAGAMLCLLPYSFLTYMPRVPSRHTYLASLVLSLVVGFAWASWRDSARARLAGYALLVMMVVHNTSYIWIKKHPQYVRRAEPTERLLEFGRTHPGQIHIRCFPYPRIIAVSAFKVGLNRAEKELSFDPVAAVNPNDDFCYDKLP
jgi:hypothetical protein